VAVTNRVQVTVVAPRTTLSDALATAVCVLGGDAGLRVVQNKTKAEALVVVSQEGQLKLSRSRHFPEFAR
jgi:thiamine biosynthesis lipoprotein